MNYFCVLEGPDGCGKTTIAKEVVSQLKDQGIDAEYLREPGSNPVSELIRSILADKDIEKCRETEATLFFAARIEMIMRLTQRENPPKVIICDRFIHSTLVYQIRLNGVDSGLITPMTEWVLDRLSEKYLGPVVFYLRAPFELLLKRREGSIRNKERFKDIPLEKKRLIYDAYESVMGIEFGHTEVDSSVSDPSIPASFITNKIKEMLG